MTVKNKIKLTLAIFILLVFLIVVFVILPLFSQIKESSEKLIKQKEDFIGLEFKIESLEKIKEIDEDINYFLDEVDNLFVDSSAPIEFIRFLEEISKESQLETEISSVSSVEKKEYFWPYLNFQINSIGTFSNFLKFLEKIENNPYLIELQSININNLKEDRESDSSEIKAGFSVKVFVN